MCHGQVQSMIVFPVSLIISSSYLRKERLTICGFKQKEKLPIGKLFLQLFGKEAKSFQQ